MQFEDLYQPLSDDAKARAKKVKLLICDIDGVFSDGRIYLGNQGEELKAFNTKDGFGIKALINSGFEVAVITGRHSEIVQTRMSSLTVQHIYQGQEDKLIAYQELKNTLKSLVSFEDSTIRFISEETSSRLEFSIDNSNRAFAYRIADFVDFIINSY